MTKVNCR